MTLHLFVEDNTDDPADTPGAVGDDDLRHQLAEEAREYEWLARAEE